MTPRHVVIAGEIYSPNLGDGVIFDSLNYLIHRLDPRMAITPLDISGRQQRSSSNRIPLQTRLSMVGRLYTPLGYRWINHLQIRIKYFRKIKANWTNLLENTDMIIIGGGQLLQDNLLDFPYKLFLLSRLAQAKQIPIHIVGVGVGKRWSNIGRKWVQSVLNQAISVSVRDEESRKNLQDNFQIQPIYLSADPAFWAKEAYGLEGILASSQIGVGILNPVDLNLSRSKRFVQPTQQTISYWLSLCREIMNNGSIVELFTNGNYLDEQIADHVLAQASSRSLALTKSARPMQPRDLACQISHYRVILAARLHANLLAAVYGIPAIGIAWEPKVTQLYTRLGNPERAIALDRATPGWVAQKLMHISDAISPSAILNCKEQALVDVARLIN